ncbi:hypothetical protein AVEN_158403-1, partial [Araneus ventricosus]
MGSAGKLGAGSTESLSSILGNQEDRNASDASKKSKSEPVVFSLNENKSEEFTIDKQSTSE